MTEIPTEFPTKLCPKCKENKVFYIHFTPKGGMCKECANKRAKEWNKRTRLTNYMPQTITSHTRQPSFWGSNGSLVSGKVD